jgi:hypothetical protein
MFCVNAAYLMRPAGPIFISRRLALLGHCGYAQDGRAEALPGHAAVTYAAFRDIGDGASGD